MCPGMGKFNQEDSEKYRFASFFFDVYAISGSSSLDYNSYCMTIDNNDELCHCQMASRRSFYDILSQLFQGV